MACDENGEDSGITLNKRVRIIIGTDEESGFRCVKRYFEKEEMPTIGFAPDADFPIINAEKGIASLVLKQKRKHQMEMFFKREIGQIWYLIMQKQVLSENLKKSTKISEIFMKIDEKVLQMKATAIIISVKGKSAHAMEPDKGVNAAVLLAYF